MARILRRTHNDRHLRRIIKNQEQIIRRLVRLETRLVRLAVKSGVDVTVQGRQQPRRSRIVRTTVRIIVRTTTTVLNNRNQNAPRVLGLEGRFFTYEKTLRRDDSQRSILSSIP